MAALITVEEYKQFIGYEGNKEDSRMHSTIDAVSSAITEYLGAFDADLVNRPDGTPLEVGDLYYNTTSTETRIWTGAATGWDLVFGRVQPLSTTYTSTGLTTLTLSARPSSVLSILICDVLPLLIHPFHRRMSWNGKKTTRRTRSINKNNYIL